MVGWVLSLGGKEHLTLLLKVVQPDINRSLIVKIYLEDFESKHRHMSCLVCRPTSQETICMAKKCLIGGLVLKMD